MPSKSWVAATSIAIPASVTGASPLASIPAATASTAALFDGNGAARPPSSATRSTSWPRLRRTTAVAARMRTAHSIASPNDEAPTGTTRTSWMSIDPTRMGPSRDDVHHRERQQRLALRGKGAPERQAEPRPRTRGAVATEAASTAFAPESLERRRPVEFSQGPGRPRSWSCVSAEQPGGDLAVEGGDGVADAFPAEAHAPSRRSRASWLPVEAPDGTVTVPDAPPSSRLRTRR